MRRSRFLTGEYNADLDVKDVQWLTPEATDIEDWHDPNARCFGMLIDGRAQASGIKRPALDVTGLILMNAHHEVVKFKLPEVMGGSRWRCLIDTNEPELDGGVTFQSGDEYELAGRSLVFLALQPDRKRSIALRRAREAFRQMAEEPIPVAPAEPAAETNLETQRSQS